jgi:hypothetical protein
MDAIVSKHLCVYGMLLACVVIVCFVFIRY